MIFNKTGKDIADNDALKTVQHFLSIGIESRLATADEDRLQHFDIVVDGSKIDLKRFNGFYCEITKLQNPQNEADKIWMIVKDNVRRTYLIDKKALIECCAEILNPFELSDIDSIPLVNNKRNKNVVYKLGKSCGDKLAYFDISMLDKKYYQTIDMNWLN